SANLPPPSAADIAPATEATGSTTAVTLPDPPELPPPTFKDAPAPATTATVPATPAQSAAPSAAEPAKPAAAPESIKPAEPTKAAAADQPLRDALREFIGSPRLARLIERKTDRTAVEAFYAARDYAPVFAGNDGPTALAKQAVNHLRNADADG